MKKELNVHLTFCPEAEVLQYLRAQLEDWIHLTVGEVVPKPAHYHILVAGRPTMNFLQASPNLTTLIIPWAGLPQGTKTMLVDFPQIQVHNLHHNAGAAAELTVTLLLAAAKFIVPLDRKLRRGDWTPRYEPNPSLLLEHKTALILGYGAIGQRVAKMCQGLGMTVRAVRRHIDKAAPYYAVSMHQIHELSNLLPQTQALIICLPLTAETENLIGAAELHLLPNDAVVVNIGRGKIINQEALYNALHNRTILAAGLDVWYNYPGADESARTNTFPADFPFHELDNVVLSPHRGGALFAREAEIKRMNALAELLNAAANGQPIPNPVNLYLGY